MKVGQSEIDQHCTKPEGNLCQVAASFDCRSVNGTATGVVYFQEMSQILNKVTCSLVAGQFKSGFGPKLC